MFQKKNILISGASSGLGKELAFQLAKEGANLALIDIQGEKLHEVATDIAKITSSKVWSFACDVANPASMVKAANLFFEFFDRLDILVVNAGVGGINPGDTFDLAVHQKIFRVNVDGTIHTIMPFLPHMIEKKQGQIVGICSMASLAGAPMALSYSSSKAAQARIFECLRFDLARYQIHVSLVFPGFIDTPMANHREFTMPFRVSQQDAAKRVLRAIANKKYEIYFPLRMRCLTLIQKIVPYFILIPLLNWKIYRNSKKTAKTFS